MIPMQKLFRQFVSNGSDGLYKYLLSTLLLSYTITMVLVPAFADDQNKLEQSKQSAPGANNSSVLAPAQLKVPPQLAEKTLIVGISEQPPFSMKDDEGKWVGIAVELWERIAGKLNLKYEYRVTDLDGVVKGMRDRTFDLEATPAFITDDGEKYMDFSAPYYAEDFAVAINSDQQPSFIQAALSTISSVPFLGLLLAIVGVTLSGALVLWMLEHKGDSEHYKGRTRKAFIRSLYWSVSVLTGRDFPSTVGLKAHPPGTSGGQMFALSWTMVGVMVFSLFTASAASLLTSRQMQGIVSQWSDLKHLHVGTVNDPDSHEFLKARRIPFLSYETPLQMMTALHEHKLDAAVFPRSGLTYYAHNVFNDQIVILPLASQMTYMGLPLQLGSPLRKPINAALFNVTQSKSWPKILTKYLGTGNEKAGQGSETSDTSGLDGKHKQQ